VDGVEPAKRALLDHDVAVARQREAAAEGEGEDGEQAREMGTMRERHDGAATPDAGAGVTASSAVRQITGHADFRISQEYLHVDVEATGMVGAKLANSDFSGEAGEFGEIVEKPAGADVHVLARARRRRG